MASLTYGCLHSRPLQGRRACNPVATAAVQQAPSQTPGKGTTRHGPRVELAVLGWTRQCGICAVNRNLLTSSLTGLQTAKDALKLQILGTCRGGASSVWQRGQVAEAQAALESLGQSIKLAELEGLWRLIYTTAPDVVSAQLLFLSEHS